MRTLLNESFPPNWRMEPTPRIFSRTVVLAKVDDLVEVGVGETVMATPGASHAQAANVAALERGLVAPVQTVGKGFKEPKGAVTV